MRVDKLRATLESGVMTALVWGGDIVWVLSACYGRNSWSSLWRRISRQKLGALVRLWAFVGDGGGSLLVTHVSACTVPSLRMREVGDGLWWCLRGATTSQL